MNTEFHSPLRSYIERVLPLIDELPNARRELLERLAQFVDDRRRSEDPANVLFICTHNSRRSQIGQLWAAAAAAHYGIDGVHTYSGGTEATAFDPRAVAAMRRAGFEVEGAPGDNPRYEVSFAESAPKQICFSKRYDHPHNPQRDFAAVMTCSQADRSCPIVTGAALRVSTPYLDPKLSDGTPVEATTYDERAQQVATEMLYLFSRVRG